MELITGMFGEGRDKIVSFVFETHRSCAADCNYLKMFNRSMQLLNIFMCFLQRALVFFKISCTASGN